MMGLEFLFLLMIAVFAVAVWSLCWVAADADERGKSGPLVAVLILFVGWPLSLLAWLAFRPARRPPEELDAEAPPVVSLPPERQLPSRVWQPSLRPGECGNCGITLRRGRTSCHWCGWVSPDATPTSG